MNALQFFLEFYTIQPVTENKMRLPLNILLKNVPLYRPLAIALKNKTTRIPSYRLFISAIRCFFKPQFQAIFKPSIRPIVNVDHRLDFTIPFTPRLIKKYLEFFQLWMGTILRMHQLYGKAVVPLLGSYIDCINTLYKDGGKVYTTIHSTTTRPKSNPNLHFAIVHTFDPHLNCIPSLHVTVVLSAWMNSTMIVQAMHDHNDKKLAVWLVHLKNEAIQIIETILFLKQHSVNCIAASLFYLHCKFDFFTIDVCNDVIAGLFTFEGKDLQNKEEIRDYIKSLFLILNENLSTNQNKWQLVLENFISDYKPDDF